MNSTSGVVFEWIFSCKKMKRGPVDYIFSKRGVLVANNYFYPN